MENNQFDPNNKPHFDSRVKNLLQIENIYNMVAKMAGMLIVGLILMLFVATVARAASTPDIFLVPAVSLTPNGAAVFQPQTGDGSNFLPGKTNTTVNLDSFGPDSEGTNIYNSGANYRSPQYDAFADGSSNMKVNLPLAVIKKVDAVDFRINNNMPGNNDGSVGTTKATFAFSAQVTSNSINSSELEYRWDFGNDAQLDSYFSRVSSITHQFKKVGEYEVKLEVLDKSGNVYTAIKKVTIVDNDSPIAYFQVENVTSPINSVIKFDTSLSSDNQYTKYNLKYRFDWDGDGEFDTNFEGKNYWYHRFTQVGSYNVLMEVTDPEGAKGQSTLTINILDDTAPTALMSVTKNGQFNYLFDGSQSHDDRTIGNNLRYRWDFNYGGPNDIVFDTSWSGSSKYSGSYQIGGDKTVRLQVMDQQGFVGESFAQIDVPWTENYLNMAVSMVSY